MLTGTYRFVFTLPYLCFFWIWKLEQSKLAMFQYKEDKKLRAEVKLSNTRDRTGLSSKATNLETHKARDRNPPNTNHKLWPFVCWEVRLVWKGESANSSDFWLTSGENPENPKTDAGKWKIPTSVHYAVCTTGASESKELAHQSRGSSMCPAKGLHILGYNTHPKLRLHEHPWINVSFSIFCSLDLQSLQTWLSVAAMIKKPSLQKLTTKPVSFSLKHFTMHFSFSAYCPM